MADSSTPNGSGLPPADPSSNRRALRRAAAVQLGYLLLFAGLVPLPNLRAAPSLLIVAASVLAAVWLIGCLARVADIPRADELLLAGSAAPVVVGLLQFVYRTNFVISNGGLSDPSAPGTSAAAFGLAWALETAVILAPGVWFLWQNARSLTPPPPVSQAVISRPASRKRRT